MLMSKSGRGNAVFANRNNNWGKIRMGRVGIRRRGRVDEGRIIVI